MGRTVILLSALLLAGCRSLVEAVHYRAMGDVGVAQAQAQAVIGAAQWQAAADTAVANAETMRAVTVAAVWAANVQLLLILAFVAFLLWLTYRIVVWRSQTRPVSDPPVVLPGPTPDQLDEMRRRAALLGGELKQSRHSGEWFVLVDGQPVKRLTVHRRGRLSGPGLVQI